MPYTRLPRRTPEPKPRKQTNKFRLATIIAIAILLAACSFAWIARSTHTPAREGEPGNGQQFDKKQFSIDDPASPWIVVNKQRPLNPTDYAPANLVTPGVPLKYDAGSDESKLNAEAARQLEAMFEAARREGAELMLVSGYRSYAYQEHLFNYFVGLQGEETALMQSARPGHSEHQTGWAADVGAANRECEIEECFGDMREGQWVANNAYRFGFIIRYPENLTHITGFDYEPWHLRYVGQDLAAELKRTGTPTLENFFDLSAATMY